MNYLLQFDGGSSGNPGPGGSGAVLFNNSGEIIAKLSQGHKKCTNNEAEYLGLIIGLERAIELGIYYLNVEGDSLLVINQLNKKWNVNAKNLKPLFEKANNLLSKFHKITINHIPRSKNTIADELSWIERPS